MAGLGRKIFTAGDVLTASDVQNYLMDQSVMVFAGTAARSSAIATPTDGMVTYNQTNNSLEAYNGTEWINKSGLQLIKKQTIGTGVSSVTVTNAFNATYENYLILVSGGVASVATVLNMTLGATATGYFGSYINGAYNATTVANANDNNAARWLYAGYGSTDNLTARIDLSMPFLTKNTYIRSLYNTASNTGSAGPYQGYLSNTLSYTDFTLTCNTGGANITGGTIYVYGYGV